MRVLIDPQIFGHQIRGGISRYVMEVFLGFQKSKKVNVFLPLFFSKNIYAINNNKYLRILNLFVDANSAKNLSINRFLNNIYLRFFRIDVFIPSFYDVYFFRHLKNKKLVVTIHDMIHEKFPEFIPFSEKVISNKKNLIHRADLIIAVSNNTKKDILEVYPEIDKNKIKVIYSGNSLSRDITVNVDSLGKKSRKYFLFIGLRNSYKNFNWMIEALSPVLKKNNLHLYCVGGGDFSEEENILLKHLGLFDLVIKQEASDFELIQLYNNSEALIMPSLYEGFGFPIIEAMSNGCPVILNTNSCFPEIAGNAGCYYTSENIQSFQQAVLKLISNGSYRAELVNNGFENAKKFTWENCIYETSEAILNLR